LFLDELPGFHRKSLEVRRHPLEEGRVTISRVVLAGILSSFGLEIGGGVFSLKLPGNPYR
jgi:hypothetical protein